MTWPFRCPRCGGFCREFALFLAIAFLSTLSCAALCSIARDGQTEVNR